MRLTWITSLIVLAFLLSAGAVRAQCDGNYYKKCWAAIAVGPEGQYGASTHAWDREEAVGKAFRSCGVGCTAHYGFFNRCAVVAYGGDGVWGFGDAIRNLDRARRRALKSCKKNGGRDCTSRFEVCSRP